MTLKKVGVFEIQFACKPWKLVSGSKPGYVPFNPGPADPRYALPLQTV